MQQREQQGSAASRAQPWALHPTAPLGSVLPPAPRWAPRPLGLVLCRAPPRFGCSEVCSDPGWKLPADG